MKRGKQVVRKGSFAVGLLGALGLFLLAARPGEAAPPGPATQVAPQGALTGTTITFTWEAAPGATWYFIQVNDATTVGKILQWYTAEQANCPGGVGTCAITVSQGLVGAGTWWIRPWNPEGFGPWSGGLQFRAVVLPPVWGSLQGAGRFVLALGGAAVLDRETGLVWERSPLTDVPTVGANDPVTWSTARFICITKNVGGRKGWRLPSIQELASLVDPSVPSPGPTLPAGHPFTNVQSAFYNSASTHAESPTFAWRVNLSTGHVDTGDKAVNRFVWCVRGAGALDNY